MVPFQRYKNKISKAAAQRQRHQRRNKGYVEALTTLKTFMFKIHFIRADCLKILFYLEGKIIVIVMRVNSIT